jgi:hypothetical protein
MNVTGHLELTPDQVEAVAARAAELVLERLEIDTRPWLTTKRAADAWGCSTDAVRMRAQRGTVERKYVGRTLYVRERAA